MVSYDAVAVTPREEALKMGDQVFFYGFLGKPTGISSSEYEQSASNLQVASYMMTFNSTHVAYIANSLDSNRRSSSSVIASFPSKPQLSYDEVKEYRDLFNTIMQKINAETGSEILKSYVGQVVDNTAANNRYVNFYNYLILMSLFV